MTGDDLRAAMLLPVPRLDAPPGPGSLSGHGRPDTQRWPAAEGQDSPQASDAPAAMLATPAGSTASRSQNTNDIQVRVAAADTSHGSHGWDVAQGEAAAVGTSSPQAMAGSPPRVLSPAGSTTAPPAIPETVPRVAALEGREASRSQRIIGIHENYAAADDHPAAQATLTTASKDGSPGLPDDLDDFPGGHGPGDLHASAAAGEQTPVPVRFFATPRLYPPVRDQAPPAASHPAAAKVCPPLAATSTLT